MTKTFLKCAGKLVWYILLFAMVLPMASFINNSYEKKIAGDRVNAIIAKKTAPILLNAPGIFNRQMRLYSIYGKNDTVPFSIIRKDKQDVNRYLVTGTIYKSNDTVLISLSDSILLNYKTWRVSAGNRINYTTTGISVNNFSLSQDSAIISVADSAGPAGNSIDISARNIDLRDVTGIFNMDTLTASGLVDAKIEVNGSGKIPAVVSGTASINNFGLKQQPVGNLQLSGHMVNENTIYATIGLAGYGSDINAAGNFFLNDRLKQLDALLDIKKLPLSLLPGILKANINVASGSLNGQLSLKGTFRQPQCSGAINIDSASFSLNQFGASYFIDKQRISFDYPAIALNRFVVKDTLNHSLVISGNLCADSLRSYDLDLTMNSGDFTLINAGKAINNQLYGYAAAATKLFVTGNISKPVVAGDIRFNERTDVRLVLPEKNIDKDAAGSVVRFIDRDTFLFTEKEINKRVVEPAPDVKKFLNNKLNFQVDSQAVLTIIIDPATGDELRVKGVTKFNAGLSSGKNMMISGIYHLDSGYYELNYQFLKKRFTLVKGSTIEFNGDPANATINIRAEYIGNTAPKDLLGNEVGTVDPRIARSFNREIPFRVLLFLKGSLNKPVISFDIQLPEAKGIGRQLRATIENKLLQLRTDVAATNKEVFALLALGRFVGEQSTDFFKGNGADFSDIDKESVSKFLSAALDKIASDLFKGINVDLNLNSYKDFTANDRSQKTDLNVEVSKNFLDDRLSVTVGKNFGIESQDASTKASQQKASRFLPDVTVNYKLSGDGKYMIRAYNKNPFEVVMDGYVVETGLAFIITMDYEKFEELFIRNNKNAPR